MNKGFFESLLDFSFRDLVTPQSLALLYGLHLLAGLIAAVVLVVNGFRDSTSQGLLMLVIGIVGFFFWTLYVRRSPGIQAGERRRRHAWPSGIEHAGAERP